MLFVTDYYTKKVNLYFSLVFVYIFLKQNTTNILILSLLTNYNSLRAFSEKYLTKRIKKGETTIH